VHRAKPNDELDQGPSGFFDKGTDEPVLNDQPQTAARLKQFVGSKKYRNLAIKTFRNLVVPIHVIHVFHPSAERDVVDGIYDVESAREFLEEENIDPETVDELVTALENGESIIAPLGGSMQSKEFFATPWMIVHAMFDGSL
jgi:hypothetical protein